eukprot:jgi/Mesen1/8510/ME000480S07858
MESKQKQGRALTAQHPGCASRPSATASGAGSSGGKGPRTPAPFESRVRQEAIVQQNPRQAWGTSSGSRNAAFNHLQAGGSASSGPSRIATAPAWGRSGAQPEPGSQTVALQKDGFLPPAPWQPESTSLAGASSQEDSDSGEDEGGGAKRADFKHLEEKIFGQYVGAADEGRSDDDPFGTGLDKIRDHLLAAQSGAATCLICLERIRSNDFIWDCKAGCHCTFHLTCIQSWARQSAAAAAARATQSPALGTSGSTSGTSAAAAAAAATWHCPKCRSDYAAQEIPREYRCYCGKERDPTFNPWLAPHTCGEQCERDLAEGCGHKCTLLCHPGPCPPCPQLVRSRCHCGKASDLKRCGHHEFSCAKPCRRQLACGVHSCEATCHAGECPPCLKESTFACRCGRVQEVRPCGARHFSCEQKCGKPLPCGRHACEVECHAGACGECPLSGRRSCPCGKVEYATLACDRPAPTCGSTCEKLLGCGKHRCPERCHAGPCVDVCRVVVKKGCRCGGTRKEVQLPPWSRLRFQLQFQLQLRAVLPGGGVREEVPAQSQLREARLQAPLLRWLLPPLLRGVWEEAAVWEPQVPLALPLGAMCAVPCDRAHRLRLRFHLLHRAMWHREGPEAAAVLQALPSGSALPSRGLLQSTPSRSLSSPGSLPTRSHVRPYAAEGLSAGAQVSLRGMPAVRPDVRCRAAVRPLLSHQGVAYREGGKAAWGFGGVDGKLQQQRATSPAHLHLLRCHGPKPPPKPEYTLRQRKKPKRGALLPEDDASLEGRPCPPCAVPAVRPCLGHHAGGLRTMPCSADPLFQCDAPCGNPLACGNHTCQGPCHVITRPRSPGGAPLPKRDDALESNGLLPPGASSTSLAAAAPQAQSSSGAQAGAVGDAINGRNCPHQGKHEDEDLCESCTRRCQKPREPKCPHPCTKPCHPGACQPCKALVKHKCHCGAMVHVLDCHVIGRASAADKDALLSCAGFCHKCEPIPNPPPLSLSLSLSALPPSVTVRCACQVSKKEWLCSQVQVAEVKQGRTGGNKAGLVAQRLAGVGLLPCGAECHKALAARVAAEEAAARAAQEDALRRRQLASAESEAWARIGLVVVLLLLLLYGASVGLQRLSEHLNAREALRLARRRRAMHRHADPV